MKRERERICILFCWDEGTMNLELEIEKLTIYRQLHSSEANFIY